MLSANNHLYVLGGSGTDLLSDVWKSSDGRKWQRIGSLPEGRGRHYFGALGVGTKIYILGGNATPDEMLADVWVCDVGGVE
jgi:N-acetylneuraminic acid mutarotase